MVTLVTSDNEKFAAEKDVVERSVLIKNMLEGSSLAPLCYLSLISIFTDVGESDQPIPLPNVSSSVLKKVGAHCLLLNGRKLISSILIVATGFGVLRASSW